MKKQYLINVLSEDDLQVIARVQYNNNLDYWDGRNFQNGGLGLHKGLTKLKDGRYVIIKTSQWEGYKDKAYVISPHMALQEILKSYNHYLLDFKKFKELKDLYKNSGLEEMEADDAEV